MARFSVILVVVLLVGLLVPTGVLAEPGGASCWGQATQAFAHNGGMGDHASQQPTPRLGLANLAEALYEAGVIGEASMQALGAFVAAELGLSIDACQ